VLDQSVAEHTLLLLLAAARRFPQAAAAAADQGGWTTGAGQELAGNTLAVIGCGPIGCSVARIAAFGFGMRVIGCTRPGRGDDLPSGCGFASVCSDFAEAVHEAAFVSLHIPAVPGTVRYLNAERIAMLAPGAWLINTARGSVVDETALYHALAAGRIAGAALDVFDREPYQPAGPAGDLRRLPNVIVTPHIASNTVQANRRMADRALRNIALAESGKWNEMDLLNPDVLSAGAPFGGGQSS
jgi:phosphoglycerate dehydrogenase-like enzyme